MPITRSERRKLQAHTFSEDKKDQFIHVTVPSISTQAILKSGFDAVAGNPLVLIVNSAGSLILTSFIFLALLPHTITALIVYSIVFFILDAFVAAPFDAKSKSITAKLKTTNIASPIAMSLNYLGPMVPVLYVWIILMAFHMASSASILYGFALAAAIVVAITLHIVNLNNTISVQVMGGKKVNRNMAMNISWLSLSGQSLSVLAVNIMAFLPVIIIAIAEALLRGTGAFTPLAIIFFAAADFSISWWHACTTAIYNSTVKLAKPMAYSKL
jgi:hypothetical protein